MTYRIVGTIHTYNRSSSMKYRVTLGITFATTYYVRTRKEALRLVRTRANYHNKRLTKFDGFNLWAGETIIGSITELKIPDTVTGLVLPN